MTKQNTFSEYIRRTLKNFCELRISKEALNAVDSTIKIAALQIVDRARNLTLQGDKVTVSVAEINTATKLVFPESLANDAFVKADLAVEKFKQSEEERSNKPVEKAQTRESRAGLFFSVSLAEKYLRGFGNSSCQVACLSSVYLAAVLEHLCVSILELARVQTNENKKVTITVRHLYLGVMNDETLRYFINSLNIVFLEAGVENYIDPKLLEKKSRKRLAPSSDGNRRPHRWRPGTKTIMTIKKLQKSGDLLIQHAPFERLVREVGGRLDDKLRYSKEFLSCFQAFVENRMTRVMQSANRIVLHSDRETVFGRDIELARSLVEPDLLHSSETFESNIPEAALKKLSLRSGIKRYGENSTEVYYSLISDFIENYMRDIIVCANLHKVQTLNTKLMLEALGMRGLHPSINPSKRRTKRKRDGASRSSSKAEDEVSDVENEALATIDE